MVDAQEMRRLNLRRLVSEHEGMNNLARKLGLSKGAYISQLLSEPGTPHARSLSEKTARKWEKQLGLPPGWLDGKGPEVGSPAATVDTGLLSAVIETVTEHLNKAKITLSAPQLADLVSMQYTDAAPSGQVDPDRIRRIVGLMKR